MPLSNHISQPLPPSCTLSKSQSVVILNSTTTTTSDTHGNNPPTPAVKALKRGLDLLNYNANRNARRGQFRPRATNKGTGSYQLRQFAEATLGSGSLRKAVKLPEGEDLNEWLAVNGERWTRLSLLSSYFLRSIVNCCGGDI